MQRAQEFPKQVIYRTIDILRLKVAKRISAKRLVTECLPTAAYFTEPDFSMAR